MFDTINGMFEMIAGCLLWLNVRQIYKDKCVAGYNISTAIFFCAWGFWNIIYYPHLGQFWSFVGGINVVIPNTIWTVMMLRYKYCKKG